MKKILLIFVLMLNLTSVVMAGDQNHVMQILTIGKEINATDEQVAAAIADGCTCKEFIARIMGKIRLIAPDKAPIGSPVQISAEGVPKKAAELWRRHPMQPTDVWLELYDRDGKQVNIFWSSDAGPRTFELVVAENGSEIPTLDIATHQLQYGKPGPSPTPVPSIPEPETPSTALQRLVEPLAALAANKILDTGDLLNLTEFYFDFADVVRRDAADVIATTATFRAVYMDAGGLMFQQTGMKGKYAGLSEIVDGIISDYIGLDIESLDAVKTSDVLNAVAWTFYQPLKPKFEEEN